jgi:hypothetical protein
MEFTGRLDAFPPASLLQWAAGERRSGTLIVRRARRERRVSFRRGEIVGCSSSLPRETFGQYLLDHDAARPDQLGRVLPLARLRDLPVGQVLVDEGILDREVASRMLAAWMSEVVQDLCAWSKGVFVFDRAEPPRLPLEVSLECTGLVLEGIRWADETRRYRELLPDDGVLLGKGPRWPPRGLGAFASKVLGGVGASSPLAALRSRVGGVEFPVLEIVHAAVASGVLEVVGRTEGEAMPSREIELGDVMAALDLERESVTIRDQFAMLPVDILQKLVPLWTEAPSASYVSGLSPKLRRFIAGFDGRTELGRLLSREREAQADEADLLFLHLQRGEVALLPKPMDRIGRRIVLGPTSGALSPVPGREP